jgi:hypothetical protein
LIKCPRKEIGQTGSESDSWRGNCQHSSEGRSNNGGLGGPWFIGMTPSLGRLNHFDPSDKLPFSISLPDIKLSNTLNKCPPRGRHRNSNLPHPIKTSLIYYSRPSLFLCLKETIF